MTRLLWLVALAAYADAAPQAGDDSFMLRGATIHTMAGPDIPNGSILVRNGKILAVGTALAVPKDVRVIDAKGLQVYPGMIDAATEVGLAEVNGVRETLDTTEIGKFSPELVALTAVNPSSEHIPVTRVNGVTATVTMPLGQLISGQVSLIHLNGWTTDEMGVKPRAGLHIAFPVIQEPAGGFTADNEEAPPGAAPRLTFAQAKRNADREIKELNDYFESARRYKQAREANLPGFMRDLKLEAMIPILEGKEPILVTAVREREIREAISFADKQKVKMILLNAAESYKVTKEIREHDIPVILGNTLSLPQYEDDPYDRSFTTAADLQKAGILFFDWNPERRGSIAVIAQSALSGGTGRGVRASTRRRAQGDHRECRANLGRRQSDGNDHRRQTGGSDGDRRRSAGSANAGEATVYPGQIGRFG
jgi:imidazolonepropionase-like amidohydrolase